MPFDELLSGRVRDILKHRDDVDEKKMFGGLCFMVSRHMLCGIDNDTLMARVGPENYEGCLEQDHVRKMDFTGKSLKGFIYVDPPGIASDQDLKDWINVCLDFISTLPPK